MRRHAFDLKKYQITLTMKILIKFWGKLWDTLIWLHPFIVNQNLAKWDIVCIQNKHIGRLLETLFWVTFLPNPISKTFYWYLTLVVTLARLCIYSARCINHEIYLLESKNSVWYKICRVIFFMRSISVLDETISNSYTQAYSFANCKLGQSFHSDKLKNPKEKYITVALWSDTWKYRSLPKEKWSLLLNTIAEQYPKFSIYLLWQWYNDAQLAEHILTNATSTQIVSLVSRTDLFSLLELFQVAHCNITVDSWLAHMASLFDTPQIFIFWPDTPDRWFPHWLKNKSYVYDRQPCSPCEQNWRDVKAVCKVWTHACLNNNNVINEILNTLPLTHN